MKTVLVVTEAFGGRSVGDQITSVKEIAAVLASDNAGSVNKIQIPDVPADPAPK